MSRRRGATLTKALLTVGCLLAAPLAQAISVGNLTFSLPAEADFASKRVVNNNKSARLYRIAVSAIDRPGGSEVRSRPVDGELLFAPRQLVLQAGESEYFKFYYHGPRDNRERYYRVSFREIPTRNLTRRSPTGGEVSMEPVVVMDTILVVRPREVQFKWSFDKVAGTVSNTGNTWFKLLIKPGCDSTEEEGDAWYLRPGDVVRQPALRQPGNHYLVYNDKFIKISDTCPLKPRPAECALSGGRAAGKAPAGQQAQTAAQQVVHRAGEDEDRQGIDLHPVVDLAGHGGQLRDVDDKRQRRVFQQADKDPHQRRLNVAQRLREQHQAQRLPGSEPLGQRRLILSFRQRLQPGQHRVHHRGGGKPRQRQGHGHRAGQIAAGQHRQQIPQPEDDKYQRDAADNFRPQKQQTPHQPAVAPGQARQRNASRQRQQGGADGHQQGQRHAAGLALRQSAPQQVIEVIGDHRQISVHVGRSVAVFFPGRDA